MVMKAINKLIDFGVSVGELVKNGVSSLIPYQGNKNKLISEIVLIYKKMGSKKIIVDMFGGTGVVAINLLLKNKKSKAFVIEKNKHLFSMLKTFQDLSKSNTPTEIMQIIESFVSFDSLNTTIENDRENYYNIIINEFKKSENTIERACLLFAIAFASFNRFIPFDSDGNVVGKITILKNDPCFNSGDHANSHKNKALRYFAALKLIGDRLEIINGDGMDFVDKLLDTTDCSNTFFFIDPPYGTNKKKGNMASYDDNWSLEDQMRLKRIINRITYRNCGFMLFNKANNPCYLLDSLKNEGYYEYLIDRPHGRHQRKDIFITSKKFRKLREISEKIHYAA